MDEDDIAFKNKQKEDAKKMAELKTKAGKAGGLSKEFILVSLFLVLKSSFLFDLGELILIQKDWKREKKIGKIPGAICVGI